MEARLTDQNDSVRTRFLDASHKPFRDGIQIGRMRRQANRFDARNLKDHPEFLAEEAGAIVDQIPTAILESAHAIGQVPGHLFHTSAVWFRDDPGDLDLPGGQSDREEHVVSNQTDSSPDLDREEVSRRKHVPMAPKEFFPSALALVWSKLSCGLPVI